MRLELLPAYRTYFVHTKKKTNFSNIPSESHDKHISEKIDHSPTLTLTPIIEKMKNIMVNTTETMDM